MKNKYVYIITFVALASILLLQGIWLYNSYRILGTEFEKNISSFFIHTLETKTVLQIADPSRAKEREGKRLHDVHPLSDRYTINRAFQDYLYEDGYSIFSLGKVDSIFYEKIKETYSDLERNFILTDSLGNIIQGKKTISSRFNYEETIQLRNIDPEYITLIVSSPYKIILGKMLLLLIGSFLLAIFIVWGLISQIKLIRSQNKIADIRQDFTNSMIHNMKNPITSIRMGVNSLKSGKIDDKPEMKDNFYSIITKESEHLLSLVNGILEIARFEEQRVILSKKQINLSGLLGSIMDGYTSNSAKKVNFKIELNGVENIYADIHYIHEAFNNLIDNAIKYSKENEDAEISITSHYKDNHTQIVFRDNGIGISVEDQKKIFQKFERAMAVIKSQYRKSGFGLGLNFVYQVIKAHDGTIEVNSRLNEYSEFVISLPNV